ncbi:hypothetical protein [Spiroplasma poulsonii]|uniref:hypothetical protein n=1 Tax=Spiroplasma poulsonii TaxID=2138 RepID=UPI001331C268|nr:hypothetical protein [Spiroplasma poulsonii]
MPENTVFTGIKIKYPKSMLFGNIKCWGNVNGVYSYPSSNIENASLVPLLSMPMKLVLMYEYFSIDLPKVFYHEVSPKTIFKVKIF